MSAAHREEVHRIAARAALDVPGVAALQPSLAERLALSAPRPAAAAAAARAPAGGIRAAHTPEGGWHVEVRCVLRADRRAVDIARQVRERVGSAVTAWLAQHDAAAPLTVLVTVTGTV
ncbi:hypothetical protein AB0D45_33120 [Streptomyces sp. NPDC048352]|uniref:hypothetical protein n=1 Tax=Streptomyces sp. NPDC048352 TaxID=3154718 RepID=UPI003418E346